METKLVLNFLIKKIKEKKELNSLDDDFVKKEIESFLKKKKFDFSKYDDEKKFSKSAICKEIVSSIRAILREVYGVFIKKPLKKLDKQITEIKSYDENLNSLLLAHQSSKERVNFYLTLYPKLFEVLFSKGLPKKFSMIDLACGFNPFAYKFLPIKPNYYLASDLSSEDMNHISTFFKNTNIRGESIALNLLNAEVVKKLNSKGPFDLCFLLKALDSLETRSRHSSKKLISSLKAKYFVVSFPKSTIGGKNKISSSKRSWFEKFCIKEYTKFETLEVSNEVFYIFKK